MATQLTTSVIINANPAKIWSVLMDFEQYCNWNPFIQSIKYKNADKNALKILLKTGQGKTMSFEPKVLKNEKNRLFQWKGKLLFKGLFDGTHSFELIEQANGTTSFVHSEKFSGILVPFLKKMILGQTKNSFEAMNEALKLKCEQ